LSSNECGNNPFGGINYAGTARGRATDNVCEHNGHNGEYGGMSAYGHARVDFVSNTCDSNQQYGIYYADYAVGRLRLNVCIDNKYGIAVSSPAKAKLSGNRVVSNSQRDYLTT
jgi:hypothetical protein